MSAPSPGNLRSYAIRLVVAGVGTAVAGPLGAAMGAALGGVFSEQAAKLLETYLGAGGAALSELGVHHLYDQLRETREHPPLEAVVQQALRLALEEVRRGLPLELDDKYADWFANWDSRLGSAEPSATVAQLSPDVIPADVAAQERILDELFQSTMERLDGEARANKGLSIVATDSFRTIPKELLHLLVDRLPAPLQSHFRALIGLPEHESAWIAVQQNFQENARSALAKLDAATHRTETKVDRILEIQERELTRALEGNEILEQQARDSLAKAAEYENLYREALKDAAARTGGPGESQFADLLAAGDLEGAAALKTKQIEARRGELESEAKKLARDWSELGRVHDLRFAWAKALGCYREAWRLDPDDVEYGFHYAVFAQKQNRYSEALNAYLQILPALTESAHIASTLNNLAVVYRDTERIKEAEQFHKEVLKIRRGLAEASPEAYLPDVALTLNNLAVLYSDTQRKEEAEQFHQEALMIRRRLVEANPGAHLPDVAITLNNLAILYFETQRMKEAEQYYQEALTIQRRLAEANPEAYLPNVATTLNNLAVLYFETRRMKEAEPSYQEALTIRRRLAEANPEAYLPDVATTLNNLANLYRATKRTKAAEQSLDEALTSFRGLAEANSEVHLPNVGLTMYNLAALYFETSRLKEAGDSCGEARAILEPLWRQRPELYGNGLARINILDALLSGRKQAREACQFARQALAAAFDLALKQSAQKLIDQFCSPPTQ
jgi:tetratricopeptide (TPR) repeat protein